MFDYFQNLIEQKAMFDRLQQRVEALEAQLDAREAEASPETEPPRPADPPAKDDLTRIKGIGNVTAGRLEEHGYTSFAQIAALSPEEAEALEEKLDVFSGKIARENWVEQAKKLM